MFFKKGFIKNFENSQENTSAGVSFLKNETKGVKRKFWHRCFAVNFANCFRNPSFEDCQWMAAFEGTMQNNPSKSRKFSREISAAELRYSFCISH